MLSILGSSNVIAQAAGSEKDTGPCLSPSQSERLGKVGRQCLFLGSLIGKKKTADAMTADGNGQRFEQLFRSLGWPVYVELYPHTHGTFSSPTSGGSRGPSGHHSIIGLQVQSKTIARKGTKWQGSESSVGQEPDFAFESQSARSFRPL